MNGIDDFGGMHGLGRIVREENEPVFHAEWERRAFGMFAGTFVSPATRSTSFVMLSRISIRPIISSCPITSIGCMHSRISWSSAASLRAKNTMIASRSSKVG